MEGKTTRSLSNYNNRMSLQWAPDKSIEYTVYSSPGKAGKSSYQLYQVIVCRQREKLEHVILTGVSFTLPKRQIAAETTYSYKMDTLDGHIKVAGNVWFDKKRDENQKLMISLGNEYTVPQDKSDFLMRSSALFQIPTLTKV